MATHLLYCAGCNVKYKAKGFDPSKTYKCPKCAGRLKTQAPGQAAAGGVSLDSKADAADDPLIGREIGQYKILKKLGEGGMGAVYKAEHMKLGRTVALKLLPPKLATECADARERFEREARAAAVLEHPNVATVYAVGSEGPYQFIEMQYVDGESLEDRLRREGRLDLAEATRIVRDAAAALAAAHAHGLIHRDLKPGNIMLTSKGEVKVLDFGLAKDVTAPSQLTVSGHIMGTPYYMSPEQCKAEALDGRSDIYSLAATYFHLLTGSTPYSGDSLYAIMHQHAQAPVPNIRAKCPDLPSSVQPVIDRAMAKQPADRFQTMEEFSAALADAAHGAQPPSAGKLRGMGSPEPDASKAGAPIPQADATMPGAGLANIIDADQERERHLHTRRIDRRLKQVRAFAKQWASMADMIQRARKRGKPSDKHLRDFAQVRDAIARGYADVLKRLDDPTTPGHRVVSACKTSAALGDIVELPDAEYAAFARHLDAGADLLQQYAKFLDAGKRDLLKQSVCYFYWDKYLQNPRAAAVVRIAAVAIACVVGSLVATHWPKREKTSATEGTEKMVRAAHPTGTSPHSAVTDAAYRQAKALQDHGQEREAFAAYKAVLALDPDHVLAHIGRQGVGTEMGKQYDLIDEYRRLADASPNSPALQYACGRIAEDPKEKRTRYERALRLDKDFYWGHLGMGYVLQRERKYEDAVAAFKRAIEIDGARHDGHYALACLYCSMGRRDEALAQTKLIVSVPPNSDSPDCWCDAAELYGRLGCQEAAAAAKTALRLAPKMVRPHVLLGNCLDEPIEWCEKALALDPDSFAARTALLGSWLARNRTGYTPKTLEHVRRLMSDWPQNHRAYAWAGLSYYQTRYLQSWDLSSLDLHKLDFDKLSEEALRKARELEPRSANVRLRLADLYTARREYDKAFAELREAASLAPWSGAAHAKMGQVYLAMGGHYYSGEAEQAYRDALQRDPYDPDAQKGLLSVLGRQGRQAEIQKLLDAWLKSDPYSPGVLSEAYRFYRGVVKDEERSNALLARWEAVHGYGAELERLLRLNANKQFQKTIEQAKAFLDRHPTSYARVVMAVAMRQMGDSAGALKALEAYRDLLPKATSPYINIGRHYKTEERLQDAQEAYETAVRMCPYYHLARRELADLQRRMGNPNEARRTLEESLKWIGDPYDNVRIASIYEAEKKYDQAERWAKKACADGCLSAYKWLAEFYVRRGKAEKDMKQYGPLADETFKKLLTLRPKSARAWREYGDLLWARLKDNKSAVAPYKKALELDPNDFYAWHGLSYAERLGGSYAQAADAQKRAVDVNPWSAEAYEKYGRCLQLLGRPREAITQLEESLRLRGGVSSSCFGILAECYVALRDPKKVLEVTKRAADVHTANSWHYVSMAWAYDKGLRDAANAIRAYEKVAALANPQSSYQRAWKEQAERRIVELKAQLAREAEQKRLELARAAERKRAELAREAERRRIAPYLAFLAEVRTAMSQFEIDDARARCEQAAKDPALKPFAKQVAQETQDIERARKAWEAAAKAAVAVYRKLKLKNGITFAGEVRPAESPFTISLRSRPGIRSDCHLSQLDTAMLAQLANDGLFAEDAEKPIKLALLWYYAGAAYLDNARRELHNAKGIDPKPWNLKFDASQTPR